MVKLNEADVLEIRRLAQTQTYKKLAAAFGVDRTNIGMIVRGKTWKHVPMEVAA
jgi:hypothetical protein